MTSWQSIAILVAASFGALELVVKRNIRFRVNATHLWLIRLGVDGLLAFIAYPIIAALAAGSNWDTPIAVAVTAGVLAPMALRAQLVQLGDSDQKTAIGPVYVYDQFRDWLDPAIERKNSASEVTWILNRVVPAVVALGPGEINKRVKYYLEHITWKRAEECDEVKQFVESTLSDKSSGLEERVATVISKLLQLGHRAEVDMLLKDGRQALRASTAQ
jgi:hypothetical protein